MENLEIQFTNITLFFICVFMLLTILLFYFFYKWGYFCGLNNKSIIFPLILSFLVGLGGILFVLIGYHAGIIKKDQSKK
ncbi:hypothetical protein [Candidatus Phytoplasma citri]|uniref:Uncharacterized protein n=1 Tax=Candidatus Phytoplasma citri TaxID=180978 RepID=A0A1S9M175_9MOLU|nr:hypothetical protein [Candidatus Phytoplasma aurantifolia]MDO8060332.1 hypothetical protein [Candidatus Phytoplasma aurantifolia]MDO8078988.1 hypothetical protein [Candidatus Phytoplasma aurantifolia]OOP58990.1 hypothetical protein B2G44_01350 [Candidatus Phytoplasma aurantifolia]